MQNSMTELERIASIKDSMSKHTADPLGSLYGEELPTGLLARDGREFRIFSKFLSEAKSGKADLVQLSVFVNQDGKPFGFVGGVTYLPKFAIRDQYWIMTNKIRGKLGEADYMYIESQYIPNKYTAPIYETHHEISYTPEERCEEHLDFIKGFLLQSEVKAFPLVLAK